MPDDLSILKQPAFQKAIDEFEDLMTQSSRAFLIGAGCSKCAGLPLTAELTTKSLASSILDSSNKDILTVVQGQFAGSPDANIEDFLSEIIDLLDIADRRATRGSSSKEVSFSGTVFLCIESCRSPRKGRRKVPAASRLLNFATRRGAIES